MIIGGKLHTELDFHKRWTAASGQENLVDVTAREQVLTAEKIGDADKSNFVETELVSMKITLLNE